MTAISEKIGMLVLTNYVLDKFEGVVLAARNGTVIYQGAVGLADRGRKTPHALEAPFPICSITKQFTALLIMQQVAAGKLRLDGTISDSLPDFPKNTGSQITLKHLLTHTSGLPNTDDIPDFYTAPDPRHTDPDYVSKPTATNRSALRREPSFTTIILTFWCLPQFFRKQRESPIRPC